jgi:hypothetical protein
VATAALLAAGIALLSVGYLGPYIRKIKAREFEAELERFQEKATQTLTKLQEVARSYESIRARMAPGGERDSMMEQTLRAAELEARLRKISPGELTQAFHTNEKGKRIWVLGAMRSDPDLRDLELVLEAIEHPQRGYDQDRFLLLAGEMVPDLGAKDRQRLREVSSDNGMVVKSSKAESGGSRQGACWGCWRGIRALRLDRLRTDAPRVKCGSYAMFVVYGVSQADVNWLCAVKV